MSERTAPPETRTLQDHLAHRLAAAGTEPDPALARTVAEHFAAVARHWPDGGFEVRPDQLAFAYHALGEGYATLGGGARPHALGLGCGEGKQEALAVALAATWQAGVRRALSTGHPRPKLLFVTSSPELVAQVAASPALAPAGEAVVRHDGDPRPQREAAAGIHLLDTATFLNRALDREEGRPCPLFDGVTKVFVDEVQAFLGHTPVVRSHGPGLYDRLLREAPADALAAETEAAFIEALLRRIERLARRRPQRIGYSDDRERRRFNPAGETTRHGTSLQDALRRRLLAAHGPAMARLGAADPEGFAALCDTVATALARRPGRDYYLESPAGAYRGYCVADRDTGQPQPDTRYADPYMALLVGLKHASHRVRRTPEEWAVLLEGWLRRETTRATPDTAVRQLGADRYLFASATLAPVRRRLEGYGCTLHTLQPETNLDPADPAVRLTTTAAASAEALAGTLDALPGGWPEQVVVTTPDAALLERLEGEARASAAFAGREVHRVCHDPVGGGFGERLAALSRAVHEAPAVPRLILVQGLGEGSNLLGRSPRGAYRGTVVKLDLSGLDRLTHTRYRVGARGRAEGAFVQALPLAAGDLDRITAAEYRALCGCATPEETARQVLAIQEAILREGDRCERERVVTEPAVATASRVAAGRRAGIRPSGRPGHGSRRAFLRTGAGMAMGIGAVAVGLIAPGKGSARKIEIPPGIEHARDPALEYAYKLWHADQKMLSYGNTDSRKVAQWVMDLGTSNRIARTRISEDTPFKEPAYYFMASEMRIQNRTPDFEDIKKRNEPLAYFKEGITNYFVSWVPGHENRHYYRSHWISETEENLLKAVFTAAGRDAEDVEGYQELDLEGKEKFLKGVMNSLENKSYDEQIVAAWASFFLTTHYDFKLGQGVFEGDSMYEVEQATKEMIGHPVRGPPFYGITNKV